MRATISVMGLYLNNPKLFENMALPASVDRETLVGNLVAELAELEVLYPSGEFMRTMIELWSRKELPTWNRIERVALDNYNPLENYNRVETWEDEANSTSNSSANNTNSVTGYNSGELVISDASQSDGNAESGATSSHTGTVHGNIGVMSSQQMAEQEITVSPKLNLYSYIIESFKMRFCLLIY